MKAIAWVFGTIIVIFLIVWLFSGQLLNLMFPDKVEVVGFNEAEVKNIRIDWTVEGQADTISIYTNGEQLVRNLKKTGRNYFMLYYQGEYLDTFSQFKTNQLLGHQYTFYISQQGDSLLLDLKISGPDAAH